MPGNLARKATINQSKEETEVIDEDDEDWKLEVMHGVNAGVHASVSLGLVFFQSKARVWVDCSVPAAWKTAMIALQSKARGWVDCALNIVLTCIVLVLSCEPVEFIVHGVHGAPVKPSVWFDCSSVPLFKAKPEVGLIVH